MARLRREVNLRGQWSEKQLGQLRPANTTAASLYSPPTGIISTEVTTIFVTNTTAGAIAYRVFIDEDGTTYDETTALYYDVSLGANTTEMINPNGLFMNNSSGNLAVRTATNDALNFTAYGIEILTKNIG